MHLHPHLLHATLPANYIWFHKPINWIKTIPINPHRANYISITRSSSIKFLSPNISIVSAQVRRSSEHCTFTKRLSVSELLKIYWRPLLIKFFQKTFPSHFPLNEKNHLMLHFNNKMFRLCNVSKKAKKHIFIAQNLSLNNPCSVLSVLWHTFSLREWMESARWDVPLFHHL